MGRRSFMALIRLSCSCISAMMQEDLAIDAEEVRNELRIELLVLNRELTIKYETELTDANHAFFTDTGPPEAQITQITRMQKQIERPFPGCWCRIRHAPWTVEQELIQVGPNRP
jgi:hypothetical protein